MRGDEKRVVSAFAEYLERAGWTVTFEQNFCDIVVTRDGQEMWVEAKGRTAAVGLDVDTMYGQILRRMPPEPTEITAFAVVVPEAARTAALRIPRWVRQALKIDVYVVSDTDSVEGPLDG